MRQLVSLMILIELWPKNSKQKVLQKFWGCVRFIFNLVNIKMENKTNDLARHGDISFRATTLPKGIKLKKVDSFILAEGDATSNKHRLTPMKSASIKLMETTEGEEVKTYFKVENGEVSLTHEEHKEIIFGPNQIYLALPEREFDYFLDAARRVVD